MSSTGQHDEPSTVPPPLKQTPTGSLPPSLPSPNKRLKQSRSLFGLRSKVTPRRERKDSTTTNPELTCGASTSDPFRGDVDTRFLCEPISYEDQRSTSDLSAEQETKQGDVYRWAIMYENQRGIYLFASPHYSSRSLLPKDPAPFTIPAPKNKRKKSSQQPENPEDIMRTPFSLRDYQLPDARWRWVSKAWMVDMRGDGEVCSAGFEYNWMFREHGWRPIPGRLNAGGWVRRRRWVRLMMRPAESSPSSRSFMTFSESKSSLRPTQSNGTLPLSSVEENGDAEVDQQPNRSFSLLDESLDNAVAHTWRGDAEGDWTRCRRALHHCRRDGKKLEVWREWLGLTSSIPILQKDYITAKRKGKGKETDATSEHHWGEVVESPTSPGLIPQPAWIISVVKSHAPEILSSFVFPDSRAQFLQMLDEAKIGRQVVDGVPESSSLEFWSRRSVLVPEEDDAGKCFGNDVTKKELSMGGVEKKVSD